MTVQRFRIPVELVAGRFATVDQGSADQVVQSVTVLLRTVRGMRIEVPSYGIDDPTFATSPNVSGIRAAVRRWVPQAQALVTDGGTDPVDEAIRNIDVAVRGGNA